MLQIAWTRLLGVIEPRNILVCTGAAYRDEVMRQLPDLSPDNVLGEPEGRDSLNAVAWSSAVLAKRDPDAVVAMVTADQVIEPVDEFASCLESAFDLASHHPATLVTFGVVPTRPHTGYGYLEKGEPLAGFPQACQVAQFHEKPDEATARHYVESGRYWWNAGMFVWKASCFLEQLRLLLPASHAKITTIAENPERLDEIFPTLLKTSVDYAIMEPVSRGEANATVCAIPLNISWSDVGSFESLYELLDHDADGNTLTGAGLLEGCQSNLVFNTDPESVVACIGITDMVVVHTEKAVLVMPRNRGQDVKKIAADVAKRFGCDKG